MICHCYVELILLAHSWHSLGERGDSNYQCFSYRRHGLLHCKDGFVLEQNTQYLSIQYLPLVYIQNIWTWMWGPTIYCFNNMLLIIMFFTTTSVLHNLTISLCVPVHYFLGTLPAFSCRTHGCHSWVYRCLCQTGRWSAPDLSGHCLIVYGRVPETKSNAGNECKVHIGRQRYRIDELI